MDLPPSPDGLHTNKDLVATEHPSPTPTAYPPDTALQSATSIPAESLQQGHRIGYSRPGYDAGLVIADDHPLQVGATAVEFFIDGSPLLHTDIQEISKRLAPTSTKDSGLSQEEPAMRTLITTEEREDICSRIKGATGPVVLTGIEEALIDIPDTSNLVLVVENNKSPCLGTQTTCLSHLQFTDNLTQIHLTNGHITPGLIAFGNNLGIQDIPSEPSTGDGTSTSTSVSGEDVHLAQYGIHLHGKGKAFNRAPTASPLATVSAPQLTILTFPLSVNASLKQQFNLVRDTGPEPVPY
ncbi:hypothetical protein BDV10DRAFT_184790 [Aspergillus recurvatus]